jgi:dihydrofolate synthase/folylpolyglutamate synthase
MRYAEAIDYLLSFADFERSGRFRDRPDVAPVRALLSRLGNPHLGRATVHVAGSKGKGSVAAVVESILREAGYSTGLYISPHLYSYCERVQVNGEQLSEERFASLARQVRDAAEAVARDLGERGLVTFDLLTAIGFLAFRESGVDVQVVEVGLGGRVDSTNVFDSKEAAVVTALSLEHTAILGNSIERIAREKAAIIRPGCAAVMAPQAYEDAEAVVRERALESGAELVDVARGYRWRRQSHDLYGQEVRIERLEGVVVSRLPLLGEQALENAATAVATADALRRRGFKVPEAAVCRGLAKVHWPCRMEVVREKPLVIVDGAHNRDSARRFREALSTYFRREKALFVIGTSADKDIDGMAEELAPAAEAVIAARSKHPRAMDPEKLAESFRRRGIDTKFVESVADAIDLAMAISDPDGVICLVGSLFVAAEGREYVLSALGGQGVRNGKRLEGSG